MPRSHRQSWGARLETAWPAHPGWRSGCGTRPAIMRMSRRSRSLSPRPRSGSLPQGSVRRGGHPALSSRTRAATIRAWVGTTVTEAVADLPPVLARARGDHRRRRNGPRQGQTVTVAGPLSGAPRNRPVRSGAGRPRALGCPCGEGTCGHPAQVVRTRHRRDRRPCADPNQRAGQAAGRSTGRDRLCCLVHRMVRRGGQAGLRGHHTRTHAGSPHHRAEAARRRDGGDHAVELPGGDDHPQDRSPWRRAAPWC